MKIYRCPACGAWYPLEDLEEDEMDRHLWEELQAEEKLVGRKE